MIPKIVHYAWFGREIPIEVEERVQRWKQILPDWEFKLWNEENWDFSYYSFSKQMYETKNWAYLALMSRLWTGFFGTERYRTPKIFQNPDFTLKRRDFWVFFIGGTGASPAGEIKQVV